MESPLLDEIEATARSAGPGWRGARARHTVRGREGTAFEGLWIEVDDLTNGDVEVFRRNNYLFDLFRLFAPKILGWNVEAPVYETVEEPAAEWDGPTTPARTVTRLVGWERLPPPAEAGPDVFLRLPDAETREWVIARMRGFSAEHDEAVLKALATLGRTPGGSSGGTAPGASAAPSSTGSRRARRG